MSGIAGVLLLQQVMRQIEEEQRQAQRIAEEYDHEDKHDKKPVKSLKPGETRVMIDPKGHVVVTKGWDEHEEN